MTRQLVMAFSVLTLPAGAAACGSHSASPPASSGSSETVSFTESEFQIEPATLALKPGTYVFNIRNTGQLPHDLRVTTSDGSEVARSQAVTAGTSTTVEVKLQQGTYTVWCSVGDHRARGMESTITVS